MFVGQVKNAEVWKLNYRNERMEVPCKKLEVDLTLKM